MLWAWIFLLFHCLCCKSSLRLLDILTGCLSVCIPVAVFVYSILLTAFSRSITCLVKLRTFAEFTSHIAVWGNITERCVLSLEGFLKRQGNPLSCCWGPLFIIQLLSLCTVLTLDQTRKNIFVVVKSWFLLRGDILVTLLAKRSFSTAFLLLHLSSCSNLSNYIVPKGTECCIWAQSIPFLPLRSQFQPVYITKCISPVAFINSRFSSSWISFWVSSDHI